jgi:hypothetical protein
MATVPWQNVFDAIIDTAHSAKTRRFVHDERFGLLRISVA